MLTISKLCKEVGVNYKQLYRALLGLGSGRLYSRIQTGIFKLTGLKVSVNDISMGRYSYSPVVRQLCNRFVNKQTVKTVDTVIEVSSNADHDDTQTGDFLVTL